jgi:hypothetical protein
MSKMRTFRVPIGIKIERKFSSAFGAGRISSRPHPTIAGGKLGLGGLDHVRGDFANLRGCAVSEIAQLRVSPDEVGHNVPQLCRFWFCPVFGWCSPRACRFVWLYGNAS